MKLVVRVKLLPSREQAAALEATLRVCNQAADHVSKVAFATGTQDRNGLQKLLYADIKERFGLSAQPAVRVVKKVTDAYAARKAQARAGLLGRASSRRYRKAMGSPVGYRPGAAQPFDDRCLSWQGDARTVSIWTVAGRMKNVAYTGSAEQLKMLAEHRKGESDLVCRKGKWYLMATCEIAGPEIPEPGDWVGVDRGIVNLATTSDGVNYQGRRLTRYRRWHARKRAEFQAVGTRSARRRLARRAGKEQAHATHVNHEVSKEIVSVAQRTGRGIAVEQLDGIRERVRLRRDQRGKISSWPFHQLGQHLAYKARRAGVAFLEVDAAYTSQRCPRCGHTERANRPDREHFRCRRCGLAGPADVVAGVNVRNRARSAWVFVNRPVPPRSDRAEGREMRPVTVPS